MGKKRDLSRYKGLIGRYTAEELRSAIKARQSVISANRDKTATRNSGDTNSSFSDVDVPKREVRFDDGPLGFLPVVGDVLLGAQVLDDLGRGRYGEAALDAGLMLLPNVVEKPLKAGCGFRR